MKALLKQLRIDFREAVFKRDDHKCVCCMQPAVDAHHITDRHDMPNGGYTIENGISLCSSCHLKAENFHDSHGESFVEGYRPNDLYRLIGSSHDRAVQASEKLGHKR